MVKVWRVAWHALWQIFYWHTPQTQYYIYRLDIMRELDKAKSEEIELAGAPAV